MYDLDKIFLGLAHPIRLKILKILLARGRKMSTLSHVNTLLLKDGLLQDGKITRQNRDKHLNILLKVRLIKKGKIGKDVVLSVNPLKLRAISIWLKQYQHVFESLWQ
jgi:DNA-binding transcriptional ArsR family regulator